MYVQLSLWLPRQAFPASKLWMVPMVVPMVPMAAQVGVPGLQVTDGSYGGCYGSSYVRSCFGRGAACAIPSPLKKYVRSCFGRGAACATPSPLKQNGSIPDFKVKEVFL